MLAARVRLCEDHEATQNAVPIFRRGRGGRSARCFAPFFLVFEPDRNRWQLKVGEKSRKEIPMEKTIRRNHRSHLEESGIIGEQMLQF